MKEEEKNEEQSMTKIRFSKVIRSPLFLLFCIFGGIYIGLSQKELAPFLSPAAVFYTNLLQITVIPIIAITILTSMVKLLTQGTSNSYVVRILSVFCCALMTTGAFAVLAGYILQPGQDMSNDPSIVQIVEDNGGSRMREVSLDDPVEKKQSVSVVEFIVDIIPSNIFKSLSNANMLQIIVFCVIFSVACGLVSRQDKRARLQSLGDYLPVLYSINEKVLFFLPFGSFCLLATQLSNTSGSAIFTILSLALTMLSVILTLTVICSIILWRCSRKPYFETVRALFETLITAFSTQSSILCVPRAVNAMSEKLGFSRQTVELTLPLGVPLCQFSTVCFYAIGTIFIVNIFNENLNAVSYLFITLASILTSFAASGVKGVIYYSLMEGILAPLGVPLGNTIALFIAVDPLVDPFGTMFHMYAVCCSTAICCRWTEKKDAKKKNKKLSEPEPATATPKALPAPAALSPRKRRTKKTPTPEEG